MPYRIFVALLVCGCLLTPRSAAAEGGTYRSPTLGFEMTWDDSWTARYAGPGPSLAWIDYIALTDDIATLSISSTFNYGDDTSTCLQALIDNLIGTDGVSDVYQLTDTSGADLVRHDRAMSWIYAGFQLDDGRGRYEMGAFLFCQVFPDTGWGTLLVALYSPLDDLEAEIERASSVVNSYRAVQPASTSVNYGSAPSSSGPGSVSCDPAMVASIQEDLASTREGGRMSSNAMFSGMVAGC